MAFSSRYRQHHHDMYYFVVCLAILVWYLSFCQNCWVQLRFRVPHISYSACLLRSTMWFSNLERFAKDPFVQHSFFGLQKSLLYGSSWIIWLLHLTTSFAHHKRCCLILLTTFCSFNQHSSQEENFLGSPLLLSNGTYLALNVLTTVHFYFILLLTTSEVQCSSFNVVS